MAGFHRRSHIYIYIYKFSYTTSPFHTVTKSMKCPNDLVVLLTAHFSSSLHQYQALVKLSLTIFDWVFALSSTEVPVAGTSEALCYRSAGQVIGE